MERLEIEACLDKLLAQLEPTDRTRLQALEGAEGMVTAQDIIAGMMVPPYPKSAMDGYAVRAEDIAGAEGAQPVTLRVIGELFAGDYQELPYEKGTAVRVMTGSYIPKGYDTIVRQEDTDLGEQQVQIYVSLRQGMNYCQAGEDIQAGDCIIPKNTRLTPLHIGLLASLGITQVQVYEPLRVSILSTGSELTAPGQPLMPGRIYNSISYILAASIRRQGLVIASMDICEDEEETLRDSLQRALDASDLVITTGGVSVGKKDLLPKVLTDMGAKLLFTRANIQPGTPTIGAVLQDKVLLSLSGNPYAAIANFEYYFWAIAAKWMHSDTYQVQTGDAVLQDKYDKVNHNRRMLRAIAADGKVSLPSKVHASSVISNMTQCNCFIDLEAGRALQAGDTVKVRYYK